MDALLLADALAVLAELLAIRDEKDFPEESDRELRAWKAARTILKRAEAKR